MEVPGASLGARRCLVRRQLTGFEFLPFAAHIVMVLATSRERRA